MPLLLLMILIMPFEETPYLHIADDFPGLGDLTVIKILGFIGFAWAMFRIAAGDRRVGVMRSRQAKIFMIFFVATVAAAALAGGQSVLNARYLAFVAFLPFVVVAVRDHQDVRRVIYAIALSHVLVFPYAVRQMLRFGTRLGVGLYESNYYAANLLIVVPIAFAIAMQQPTPGRKRFWLAATGLLAIAVFMTQSRGALLGLVVAGMVYAYRRRGVLGALALLTVLVFAALPTEIGQRALATLSNERVEAPAGLEASNRAHEALFWGGLRMISDHPLVGVGPFNFKQYSTQYSGLDQAYIGHNSYIEVAAELGLPVLVLFAALVVVTFGALRRTARLRGTPAIEELAGWAEGMRTGLIGFLVAGTFISAEYEKLFWLCIFMSIVMERVAQAEWRAAEVESADVEAPAALPLEIAESSA